MTAPFVAFALFDADGVPLTTASPAFAAYKNATSGANRSAPSISHLGGGVYGFAPTESDSETGIAYEISCGAGAYPERYSGAVSDDGDVVAFGLYDSDGAPTAGATPAFATYKDGDGAARSQPTITDLGLGLYAFRADATDISTGTAYEINASATLYPRRIAGSLSSTGGIEGFGLYDASDAPLTGVSVSVDTYKDAAGSNRSAPSMFEIGGGLYRFTPSASDVTTGAAYELNAGASATPARLSGAVSDDGTLVAFALYDSSGSPLTGLTPTLGIYKDSAGVDRSAPSVVEIGGGLYGFVADAADVSGGTAYRVDAGATASPAYVFGWLESIPEPPPSALDDYLLAHWSMDDADEGTIQEATYPLTVHGEVPLIQGRIGTARQWRFSRNPAYETAPSQRVFAYGDADAAAISAAIGSWTFSGWIRRPTTDPPDGTSPWNILIALTGPYVDYGYEDVLEGNAAAIEADNQLLWVEVGYTTGRVAVRWEKDVGVSYFQSFTGRTVPKDGLWHHVSVRKAVTSASACTYEAFVDGLSADSFAAQTLATGGSNAKWWMACVPYYDGSETWTGGYPDIINMGGGGWGDYDDFRIYTRALTDSEIAALATIFPNRADLTDSGRISSTLEPSKTEADLTDSGKTIAEVDENG